MKLPPNLLRFQLLPSLKNRHPERSAAQPKSLSCACRRNPECLHSPTPFNLSARKPTPKAHHCHSKMPVKSFDSTSHTKPTTYRRRTISPNSLYFKECVIQNPESAS